MIRKMMLSMLACIAVAGCATQGSMVVTGTRRPPTPIDMIRVFSRPPAHYEVIAMLQASSHQGWTDQGSMDHAMAKLKQEAAEVGANGLLIRGTGTEYAGRYGPGMVRMAATVDAEAIYYTDDR